MPIETAYPTQIPQYAWYLHLEDHTTYTDGVRPPIDLGTRGETATLSLVFETRTSAGDRLGDPAAHLDRYERVLALREHAGATVVHETPANLQRYREQTPADAPALLIGLEPAYETTQPGVWGLVEAVDDQTDLEETLCFVDLDVRILAELPAYDSWAAANAALEATGP